MGRASRRKSERVYMADRLSGAPVMGRDRRDDPSVGMDVRLPLIERRGPLWSRQLIHSMRVFGWRRGFRTWKAMRVMRDAQKIVAAQRARREEFRVAHGEKPKDDGWMK